MDSYILLTGATGLVGRYLVRDLLLEGERLALVIRPSERENVYERSEAILQHWERELAMELPRPVCLAGDVQQEGLGLSQADRRWVAGHCDQVIHNAASLVFNGSDRREEPWTTNLDGTRHVLELCHGLRLPRLHYVSTAYVCGQRQGTIYEDELDCGQAFRNDYEHCKFLAEKLVREADFLDQRTVYRPAVIAGDSRTGYTNTYHGLYLYLKMMSVLVRGQDPDANGARHTPIRLHMSGDEPRNIVPVDWVGQVLSRLFLTPTAHGGTYHLAPVDPITPRQIIDAAYKYFNSYGVEYCGPGEKDRSLMNDFERGVYDRMVAYESYDHTDPTFDTTNLIRFCADLPCPRIDQAALHRYLEFGEADRWGKRKAKKVEVSFWAGEYLRSTLVDTNQVHRANGHATNGNGNGKNGNSANGNGTNGLDNRTQAIGLNVAGAGGGSWTIALSNGHPVSLSEGLAKNCVHVASLPCPELANLAQEEQSNAYGRFQRALSWQGQPVAEDLTRSLYRSLFPRTALLPPLLQTSDVGGRNPVPAKI
ncbi:MAG: SDR family oxidoreductase [Pirellulales bacterium]